MSSRSLYLQCPSVPLGAKQFVAKTKGAFEAQEGELFGRIFTPLVESVVVTTVPTTPCLKGPVILPCYSSPLSNLHISSKSFERAQDV